MHKCINTYLVKNTNFCKAAQEKANSFVLENGTWRLGKGLTFCIILSFFYLIFHSAMFLLFIPFHNALITASY